jgi:Tfp pilus assembly protein PilN
MIKVNLITVKRRKPIQIPFAMIFLVIALVGILAAFWFATMTVEDWVGIPDLKRRQDELEEEVRRDKDKLDRRDRLDNERRTIEMQIEQLKQLSGANLLQWSEVFSNLTSVIPEKTVWLTNLRIDSDRRVQINGYASPEEGKTGAKDTGRLTRGIQDFIVQLQGHPHFDEVFLSNATKTTYEKVSVWRFDISCRIKRDVGSR